MQAENAEIGRLEWIGVRPGRREPVREADEAVVIAGKGIAGDHYRPRKNADRQVTLIQHEHLAEIAERSQRTAVAPDLFRRNLVVSGVKLKDLVGTAFHIGQVLLEGTGPCSPCSRMDEALGPGGHAAMSGRGGITARVLRGGTIRRGDRVEAAGGTNETTAEPISPSRSAVSVQRKA